MKSGGGDDELLLEPLDPSLRNVVDNQSLKWIFVGGKGGVGKTTCSCSVALELCKHRESVLLISTDPAHNLSDAFDQKFTKTPTLVEGFSNLYVMEVEAALDTDFEPDVVEEAAEKKLFTELGKALPGVDEAMSFGEVLKQVQSMEFSVVVFDTAPTGHTLRLLTFPAVLEKALGQMFGVKSKMGGLFGTLNKFLGSGSMAESEEQVQDKMKVMLEAVEKVNVQFKNPELTTFICVCIPEFLSLYETERLVQELASFQMDCGNIIINQVLFPEKDCACKHCLARCKMQKKYIDQMELLYEDFHLVKLPAQDHEIRGIEQIKDFSQYLFTPYTQDCAVL